MAIIEQAVFTSASTNRAAGYHLVGVSPGVAEVDARELAVWGPSHDSLLDLGPDASSISFHPLPSGAYCVSHTVAAGFEYSGRGGHRVYTQCLIVSPEVMLRFANNAFAVIRAAQAGGMVQVFDPVPEWLPSLTLIGSASPVDQNLLGRLASQFGPERIATMVQAAMNSECVALAGDAWTADLIAGLINCLPLHTRVEYPFSTGLKHSSRRPFRVLGLSNDPAEHRWIAQRAHVTLLSLASSEKLPKLPLSGWPQFVARVLATRRTSLLATELSKSDSEFTADDLHALGLQLLEELDASELGGGEPDRFASAACLPDDVAQAPSRPRADAAHRRFVKSTHAGETATVQIVAPSTVLSPESPQVLERLERLDDLVFDAINGQTASVAELREYWSQVVSELGEDLLAESREQYLRYAMAVWERGAESDEVRNPGRAIQALDILCMLFNTA
ncbi:MAG: hypothetical protein U1E05_05460 [Patescibacteria group bacterium]|nr:hypothetical protein [Patescibacteria group bacterium]